MTLMNTSQRYGKVTKFMHWLLFFIILFMLILGACLDFIPKADKSFFYTLHKSVGLTVIPLMLFWIIWTCCNKKPQFLRTMPTWEKLAATIVHQLLYVCIFLMPIIGLVMSSAADKAPNFFWLCTISLPIAKNKELAHFFAELHEIFAWVITGLLAIHILAALKHLILDKDIILQRMLPWRSRKQDSFIDD